MWGLCLMLGLVSTLALFLYLRRQPRVRRKTRRASACQGGEEQYPDG